MTLSPELEALRQDALRTSCESWAIQHRWPLSKGIDRAGPCPKCGGTDRFAIHTKKNTFLCRRCDIKGNDVIALVMQLEGVEFVAACEIVTGRKASEPLDPARARRIADENAEADLKRQADAERYREQARREGHRIYAEARGSGGRGGVSDYLALRGIELSALAVPSREIKLWEHPDLPFVESIGNEWITLHRGLAMVAAVQRPDGSFGASHATWLDLSQPKGKLALPLHPDTNKPMSAKKVRGAKKGGAIRLYTPSAPRRLVMGEGIETTLTALAHNFEADTAYWAGVDLGNMAGRAARDDDGKLQHGWPDMADTECFLPPDWCAEAVYLCDSDETSTHTVEKVTRGLLRAQSMREHARADRPDLPMLDCALVEPIGDGKDLNDLVRVVL